MKIYKRVSTRLGFLLISIFLPVILGSVFVLYVLFIHFYLNYITEELARRGHNNAAVLAESFTQDTIGHINRIEKGSDLMVVILDGKGKVLSHSAEITSLHLPYLDLAGKENLLIESTLEEDWVHKPFLVSRSPVIRNGVLLGSVVMFSPSAPIRDAVEVLGDMMLLAGLVTLFLAGVIIIFISRVIVRPLIEMKRVTGEIARGNYRRRLPVRGDNEVAELASAINHMSNEIEYYQKQKNEFLADISHELRTPLTYLKGYSELLLRNHQNEEQKEQNIRIIYEQSYRLQRLVEDLFQLARMEREDFTLQREEISLTDVVTSTLSFVEPSMEQKNIQMEYVVKSEDVFPVLGDRYRLSQVFINILENARRYTPEGGEVTVGVHRKGKMGIVEIKDNGPGIPVDEVPFIMERLYRVEKSRSQATGGSGLGLAISKKLVEMHGGTIEVKSELGKGTIFFVKLPLNEKIKNRK